jgi:hypothetical protein
MTTDSSRGGAGSGPSGGGWQDAMHMLNGVRAKRWRRVAEATANAGRHWLNSPEARESAARIASDVRDLTVAEWAVASE